MRQFKILESLEEFQRALDSPTVLFYFSTPSCNVCRALKPKVLNLLEKEFPQVEAYYIDTSKSPEIAGQNRVFTIPTILIYFEGKEYLRLSRYISVRELSEKLKRIMMNEEPILKMMNGE